MIWGLYMDPIYLLVTIITLIITISAQALVKATFARYSSVASVSGLTGAEAARKVLDKEGLYNVSIERTSGYLTDYYDPTSNKLFLSDNVFLSTSISAIGVACHEAGHAIQKNEEYSFLWLRSALVPATKFVSPLGFYLVLIGAIMNIDFLVPLGIVLFSLTTVFAFVTLPVEFNASSRAIRAMESGSILTYEESDKCRKVLRAAAMTYVAAAAASILQLLWLIIRYGNRRKR